MMEFPRRRNAIAHITALAQSPTEDAVLIVGETGIGKSWLLQQAQDTSPIPAIVVRANPADSEIPHSGLSTFASAVNEPRLAEFVSGLLASSSTSYFETAQDLLALLGELQLPPTLIIVDDVDRMDKASRALIGFVGGRLTGTGLRLVLAAGEHDDDDSLGAIPAVQLSPLDSPAINALAQELAPNADEASLAILARYSNGNPLALSELINAHPPRQLEGHDPFVLPPRPIPAIHHLVASDYRALSPLQRQVLEYVSLAPLTHLGSLPSDSGELADARGDLINDDVLVLRGHYLSIRDPRLRGMLLSGLDSRTRRERHAELARSLSGLDDRLAIWHDSFDQVNSDTVTGLFAAAASLIDDGWIGAGIEFGERALVYVEHSDEHVDGLTELASAMYRRGEVELAARYLSYAPTATNAPGGALRLASLRLSVQLARTRRIPSAEVQTIAGIYSPQDPDGSARLLSLAAFHHAERWETDAASELLGQAEQYRESVDPATKELLSGMAGMLDSMDGRDTVADRLGESSALSRLASQPVDVLALLGRSLSISEHYADARKVFAVIVNHPDGGDAIWSDVAVFSGIANEIHAGDFRAARAALETWSGSSRWVSPSAAGQTLVRAWCAYSVDDFEGARTLLADAVDQASAEANRAVTARTLAIQGAIALADGDPDEAVRTLHLADSMATPFRNPLLLRHNGDLVEAYLASGRIRDAQHAGARLQRMASMRSSRWVALVAARTRAMLESGEASLASFKKAVDLFESGDSPYELGRTILAFADRLEQLGMTAESVAVRNAAFAAFETSGAVPWARRSSGSAPAANSAAPSLFNLLSDEEIEIVKRVHRGYRNKEIAEELYMSLRTVELRLTHIYRKVGARSRSQLVALLSQAREPDRMTGPRRLRTSDMLGDPSGRTLPGSIRAVK
jgi:DNA-binding CsgD family transcriptional regulator